MGHRADPRLFRVFELASVVLTPHLGHEHARERAPRPLGHGATDTRQFVSREELKLLLQMEPAEADVTTSEAEMIDKIFDLGDTAVREVMVPLVDVAALPDTATPDDAVRRIGSGGSPASRCSPTASSNLGVVTAIDLLRRAPPRRTCSLMRPATYVPETKHTKTSCANAEGPPAARGGRRRIRRRGRDRHRRGHRRGGGRRDPRRARPGPPPPSTAFPTAATAWRGARASTS